MRNDHKPDGDNPQKQAFVEDDIPITLSDDAGSNASKQLQFEPTAFASLSSIFIGVHLYEDLLGSILWARLS